MSNTPQMFTLYFQAQPSPTVLPPGHVAAMSGSLWPDSPTCPVTSGKLLVCLCLGVIHYKKGMTIAIYLTGWLLILNEIMHATIIQMNVPGTSVFNYVLTININIINSMIILDTKMDTRTRSTTSFFFKKSLSSSLHPPSPWLP